MQFWMMDHVLLHLMNAGFVAETMNLLGLH